MFPNPQDALPLPSRPNLDQYRKLAKELLRAAKSGRESIHDWAKRWVAALARQSGIAPTRTLPVGVDRWCRQVGDYAARELVDKNLPTLARAQFIIARCHGFVSWPKMVKHLGAATKKSSPESQFEAAADAIVTGDLATLRRLLRANPRLAHQRSTREHRATLLHYVSANGVEGYRQKTAENIVEITKLLLAAGAEVNAEADVYGGGATTLGLAATSCHPEAAGVQGPLMQILLDHGATVDQPGVAGNSHSAVIGCLANGRAEAAEYLVTHGAKLDLEGAAGCGRLDVVKSYYGPSGELKSGATEEQVRDGFMWACQFGRYDVVAFFLEHGVSANTTGVRRKIPGLHWAAYGGHADIVRLLLERGASVNAVEPEFNGTPLGWAIYACAEGRSDGDYYSVVSQLVRAGATVKEKWVDEEGEHADLARKLNSDTRMLAALRGELTG